MRHEPDATDPRSIVHLSGPAVCVNGRVIQRCQVCGAKLADSEGVMMPVGALGKPMPFPTWPEGRLIEVTTGNPTDYRVLVTPDDRKLPDNSCLELA